MTFHRLLPFSALLFLNFNVHGFSQQSSTILPLDTAPVPIERQLEIPASKLELDSLREKLEEIHLDLQRIKLSLFVNQNADSLDLRIVQCAVELSRQNEISAEKHWDDLQVFLATYDQAKTIATRLIQRVDLMPVDNVLPVINFMDAFVNVPQAYGALINKLNETDHFYETSQIFLLGSNIRKSCGSNQTVFKSLPPVLQSIVGSTVALKNRGNAGYLYFQSKPKNVYTWFSPHKHRNDYGEIPEANRERGQWTFVRHSEDKVQIVNGHGQLPLGGSNTTFSVLMVNDNEIKLQVVQTDDPKIQGKFLVGKGRNRGEQFSQIAFAHPDEVTSQDSLKWTAEPVLPKPEPAKVQLC